MERRVLARAAMAACCLFTGHSSALMEKLPTLDNELKRIRSFEAEMRERWIKDEDNWRTLPSRVWPSYHPPVAQQASLEAKVKSLCKTSQPTNDVCFQNRFDLATLLVFNSIDPEAGFRMYTSLADDGFVDGIVAAGVCLVEGFGVDQDYARGVAYLQRASQLGHPQADYELAVLHYTGAAAPSLPASDELAFALFERAMNQGRFSYATYMVADMLLDQANPDEYGRALSLMYDAADNGHRYARQEVLSFLSGRHKALRRAS
ncbi:hypothetical protein DYB25_006435 [Aphanomyces astaci]|uniref:Sel1 repeat family protein n=1 Tax=Aphanomyces astaci TaxID=112090 RepID=A0A397BG81_APHAT|nr:hypothetical protein DYB25_006435 [Aphanomyces astaci]